jgi:hypothetical protein
LLSTLANKNKIISDSKCLEQCLLSSQHCKLAELWEDLMGNWKLSCMF